MTPKARAVRHSRPKSKHTQDQTRTSVSPEPPPAIVTVYLVRHGETQENRDHIIQGQLDTKLNEEGIKQAGLVAEAFKDVPLMVALTSDLERARKTAEAIMENHPTVRLISEPELRERYMGELQGVKVIDRGYRKKMTESKLVESDVDFTKRVLDWWHTTVSDNLPNIPIDVEMVHVLVVSHGAFIATLVRTLLVEKIIKPDASFVSPPHWSCFNTSVTTIEMNRTKAGVLRKFSDISHLPNIMPVVETNADQSPQR